MTVQASELHDQQRGAARALGCGVGDMSRKVHARDCRIVLTLERDFPFDHVAYLLARRSARLRARAGVDTDHFDVGPYFIEVPEMLDGDATCTIEWLPLVFLRMHHDIIVIPWLRVVHFCSGQMLPNRFRAVLLAPVGPDEEPLFELAAHG